MSWPVRSQRTVYENPWIRVTEDAVVRPDGSDGIYGVVEVRNPAVFVVALNDDDEVVLVTLDRHTIGESVEVPAGGSDGDDPLVAAQRELLEETGLEATDWREVGRMDALNGICRAGEVVFLATGLRPSPHARDHAAEEGIRHVRTVPWAEVMRMLRHGEIRDGETIAALMFAALELGRMG